MNTKKICYVCHSNVENTTHSILNPQVDAKHWTPPERPICGQGDCYSVLRALATWGQCDRGCCAVRHMSGFDLDKHIEELKKGHYTENYRHWATNLLSQVGRMKETKTYEPEAENPTLNCQSCGTPLKPVVKRGLKTLEFYGKWTGQKHLLTCQKCLVKK